MTDKTNATPVSGSTARELGVPEVTALILSGRNDPLALPDEPFHAVGLDPQRATGIEEAHARFAALAPEIVILPLTLNASPTIPLVRALLTPRPRPLVIVIASNNEINTAAKAMHLGAFECLFRPFSTERLTLVLEMARNAVVDARWATRSGEDATAPQDPRRVTGPVGRRELPHPRNSLLTADAGMIALLNQVDRLAMSDAPAFITGETGAGKGLFARRLHDRSPRSNARFVTVTCALLTPQSLEAQLGDALAAAAGGSLFFDEICGLDPALQPALLSLLASPPPGGDRPLPRLISATSEDPRAAVQAGRLRADLFYRLHVAPLTVPPLRRRDSDIALIANQKLAEFALTEGRDVSRISDEAMALLTRYDWPGNVRELTNVIWSAVAMHSGPLIEAAQLPPEIAAPEPRTDGLRPEAERLVGRTLAEIEQTVIEATIRAEGGSVPLAARVLGVAPSTLYRKREAWAKHAPQ